MIAIPTIQELERRLDSTLTVLTRPDHYLFVDRGMSRSKKGDDTQELAHGTTFFMCEDVVGATKRFGAAQTDYLRLGLDFGSLLSPTFLRLLMSREHFAKAALPIETVPARVFEAPPESFLIEEHKDSDPFYQVWHAPKLSITPTDRWSELLVAQLRELLLVQEFLESPSAERRLWRSSPDFILIDALHQGFLDPSKWCGQPVVQHLGVLFLDPKASRALLPMVSPLAYRALTLREFIERVYPFVSRRAREDASRLSGT